MKPRLILLCSSLVLVLAMGAFQYGIIRLPARQQPEVEGPAAVVDTFFKWRPTHSIDDAGEMLADAYRLAPDARFLRAIEDVPRLSGEQNVRTARAQWRDRQWLVSYGEQSIGTLPEWPRFSDAESLLTNWAKRWANPALAPPSPAARQSLDAGNPLGALEILDERWKLGARDPQMFAQSGEALAWLRFCCAGDVTSHSDAIAGRAMAALALARAGGVTTSRTSAMLARDLGYCSDAERMALAMPDGDAVRAWVFADSMSLLHRTTASPTTRLLRLRWFAESEQFDRWLESVGTAEYAAKGGGHLPLYTGLLFERFDASGTVPRQAFVTAAFETQRWKRPDTSAVGRLVRSNDLPAAVERLIHAGRMRGRGVFLDTTIVEGYERGLMYSALARWGEFLRRQLASEPGSAQFARAMGKPGRGPAGEFARWYQHLQAFTWPTSEESVPIAADMVQLQEHGTWLAQRTFEEGAEALAEMRPAMARAIIQRMDTRPEHRQWLSNVLEIQLGAVALVDSALAGTAATGGRHGEQAALWLAFRGGNVQDVLKALAVPGTPGSSKASFMARLVLEDAANPMLDRVFPLALQAAPEDAYLAESWAAVLEQRGEYRRARKVLEKWFSHAKPGTDGFDTITVETREARLLRLEGSIGRALVVSERPSRSWKLSALLERARILDGAGLESDAAKLMDAATSRYPNAAGISALRAELHWRHGRDQEAAEALAAMRDASFSEWNLSIAPVFESVFHGRREPAVRAASALAEALGFSRNRISTLAAEFARRGDPETAFQIMPSAMTVGFARSLEMATAYEYLAKARGEASALEWLRKQEFHIDLARKLAFWSIAVKSHPDAAWELPLSDNGLLRDYDLVLRASVGPELRHSDPRRIELTHALRAKEDTYYTVLARYLLEGGDVAPILALAVTPKQCSEVYYWVGRRALLEGRELDAVRCYQLAIESGASQNAEYLWATSELMELAVRVRAPRRLPAGSPAIPVPSSRATPHRET